MNISLYLITLITLYFLIKFLFDAHGQEYSKLVIVESPYAANLANGDWDPLSVERNLKYLRACLHDSFMKGECPFASHGLYTQKGVLRDWKLHERKLGISAGFAWAKHATKTIVYTDLGISNGMKLGIQDAKDHGRSIEYRCLGANWDV